MRAIIKREFEAYFAHPVGYVFMGSVFLITSLSFFINVYLYGITDMSMVISQLFNIMYIIIPFLTMRLISEEKRQKTEQLLYTAPVRMVDIVLGKFLGAFLMFLVTTAFVFVYEIVLDFYATVEWGVFFSGYLGVLGVGAMLIGIGMVVSSLTESQAVAAIVSIAISFLLFDVDNLVSNINNATLTKIVEWISPYQHFESFYYGLLSLNDVFYFISMTSLLLFVTARIMDRKRWA